MLNFIKKKIALSWAKNHVKETQTFKDNAVEDQTKLLLSLVKTAEKTLFGREHQFENITTIQDFQNQVNLQPSLFFEIQYLDMHLPLLHL